MVRTTLPSGLLRLHWLKSLVFERFANPTHQSDCLEFSKQGSAFRIFDRNWKAILLVLERHDVKEIAISIVGKAGLVIIPDNRFQIMRHDSPTPLYYRLQHSRLRGFRHILLNAALFARNWPRNRASISADFHDLRRSFCKTEKLGHFSSK